MRVVPFIITAIITVALIVLFNIQLPVKGSKTPRLGFFLSPQKGFWQNAEDVNKSYDANIQSAGLKGNTEVYLDSNLIPHIYADNDADAYFAQGYLHARFRLWQMEFQTYAAGGRLSEIMGDSASGKNFLAIDKFFRRMGMVYAAENTLKVIESDPVYKAALDGYTAGVNSYINSLSEKDYPLEYKLLNYAPEPWTNMKTSLFLKFMAYDLAGYEQDFEMTNARNYFTQSQFNKLFPYGQDSLDPIIPKGTAFIPPSITPKPPADADSLYFHFNDSIAVPQKPVIPNKNNGSNNWAVAGSKTASGSPILCNDPHLGLNLPSLWFEVQISTPEYNTYGVSFPGSPSVIIGFNDSIAWGVTNAERDVKDYYEVHFKDSTMREYWYNGKWQPTTFRKEVIKIKGKPDDVENIAMTVWGPVMYDHTYGDKLHNNKYYAIKWSAHTGSNEGKTFMLLDRAKNVDDYVKAIALFQTPGQNFVFASKKGNIAISQQGAFPAKWKRQGQFVMEGDNGEYAWQGIVPRNENLIMLNPARGFVSSANQYPYDTSYPYYMGGSFEMYRGFILNRRLRAMQNITVKDMMQLQNYNYNVFAEMARPVLLKNMDESKLNSIEKKYFDIYKSWNLSSDADAPGASIFVTWWDSLMQCMYRDEFSRTTLPMPNVEHSTLLESLLKDTTYEFADDITTPQKETVQDEVMKAFKEIIPGMQHAEAKDSLAWGKFKDGGIKHLLSIPALSHLHVNAGGGVHILNAFYKDHGPSWRMIVELTDSTNAYGIYPGGQSGNPGSPYYDNMVAGWAAGKYHKLQILPKTNFTIQNTKGKITFSHS